jgi:hypothetical protein
MKKLPKIFPLILALAFTTAPSSRAWDYEGHRIANELALASLPPDFPAFVKTPETRERIAYLSGEPDRWRNTPDLNHLNGPDHYFDLEQLGDYGITVDSLTHFRYDFAAHLALARAANPSKFKPIDPTADRDHTRQLVGFLPWSIFENYEKLQSAFSCLKALEKGGGTPAEIANARNDAIYIMGVMGHYVGDASQPLHTTIHYNGWGNFDNPRGFTNEKIHPNVDGFFRNLDAAGYAALQKQIHPAKPPGEELGSTSPDMFKIILAYISEQNKQVAPLYQLEKDGKLFADGENGAEGRAFLDRQIVIGGQMLGDLWYSAWITAPEDQYLEKSLANRPHAPFLPPIAK